MKTITTTHKNIQSKLTRVLLFVALICLGLKANAQCTAGFTFAVDSADNGDVAFVNTSTGSGLYYMWDFGDGNYSSAMNPGTYTYPSSGTYTACLYVYDSLYMIDTLLGCMNSYCTTYTVINTASAGPCNALFYGYDYGSGYGYFSNMSTGTGITSTWDFGDGSTGTSTGNTSHVYSTTGMYLVCLTISDFFGTCTDSYCDTIFINGTSTGSCLGIVDPTFTATDSLGYGIFSNTPTGPGQSYFWSFGDGMADGTVGSTSHLYPANGMYFVCLTVYSATDSCQFCSFVNIGSSVSCNAAFYTNIDTTGNVAVSNISSSSGTATTYAWDFGDGTTSTLQNPPAHNYSTGGFHTICLTINDSTTACSSTFCDTIFISTCNASFTYIPDTLGNGCSFFGSTTGTGTNYFWDFGDGSTSMLQNPYHVYAANGYYNVCVTVSSFLDPTCNSTSCQYVGMTGLCDAYFIVQQDTANLYNYFVYNYSTSGGSTTYLWDFGDGTTSTLAYPSHTYATTTPVSLCLTVADGTGCTDTYCDTITPGLGMSTTFTINVINPLGVSENVSTITSLENYPNPFSDNTTINYAINKEANVSISIVDLLGHTIAEIENENKSSGEYSVTWNSQGVSDGMYLLQLKVNNNIKTKKIIVNK